MSTINKKHRTKWVHIAVTGLGLAVLAGCAGISDFNSWAAEGAEPAAHVAVFARRLARDQRDQGIIAAM